MPPRIASKLPLLLLLAPILFPPPCAAQQLPTAQILDSLRSQFDRIEDYRVDLQVSLEMPRLRLPRKKMTLHFKQPDRIHLEATGFALVPRRGVMLSPDSLFAKMHELALAGDTLLDGYDCLILRGEETGPDEKPLTARIYVDRRLWVVRGVDTYLDGREVFRLRTAYTEAAPGLHLPAETRLLFHMDEQFLPRGHSPFDPEAPRLPSFEEGKDRTGEAVITFSNYRVNAGIPDEFFEGK